LIPSRIHKVLSTMAAHRVHALLMGGQACVFYGAAEFSRDTDLLILADEDNLGRLRAALSELQAESIAVPPFQVEYLQRGHAVHFRCQHPEAAAMRVDVMSILREMEAFPKLWERRTTVETDDGSMYELLSLPDLVKAKKTQRDKDWPMLRRLVEADYLINRSTADIAHSRFWLRELRSPEFLVEATRKSTDLAQKLASERPLLHLAAQGKMDDLVNALEAEEKQEREKDRLYWQPLKAELERLRHPR
jgi:hypothetical protein